MVAGRNEQRLSASSAQLTCQITLCSTVQGLSLTNPRRGKSTPISITTTMTRTWPSRTETKIKKGKLVTIYLLQSDFGIVFHIFTSDR